MEYALTSILDGNCRPPETTEDSNRRWRIPKVAGFPLPLRGQITELYGQRGTLALFRPLGLTANGFTVPRNWDQTQINALQAGMNDAKEKIAGIASSTQVTEATNYWAYVNSGIGTYPNTPHGYLRRGVYVVFGGATIPQDNVYAGLNNLNGTSATTLDGNNTYKLTFRPPVANPKKLPVVGTLPPTANDGQGDPRGLWSITVYQPDATQSAAPFLPQTSVLNTAYSTANLPVTAVDPSTDTITVTPSAWGPLNENSPILFGSTAATYGLTPGVPYYVATPPMRKIDPKTKATTYSFKVSTQWLQQLSPGKVPIQYSGTAGGIALCQVAVTVTYASGRGHALIGRALYLPEGCAADEEHRELAGSRRRCCSPPSRSWPMSCWTTRTPWGSAPPSWPAMRCMAAVSCAGASAGARWAMCWRSAPITPLPSAQAAP